MRTATTIDAGSPSTARGARVGSPGRRALALALCVGLLATTLPRPVHAADDAPLVTLFDLSADEAATREIAFDVERALKRSKQVRYRDLDGALNVGGEEMQLTAVKSGEGFLKSGLGKIQAKQWADAVEDFSSSVDSFTEAFAHLADAEVLAKAMNYLAVAQLLGGDAKAASQTFQRANQVDPKYEQDFTEFPVKVQQAYDAARKAVLARAEIDFEVRTTPPNAKVYVNGRFMGLSPTYVQSLAGEQFVAISKHGYARKARIATVGEAGEVFEETLEPARRKPAYDSIKSRLSEIFDGAVEPNDLTEAQGLVASPFAVVLRASGTREKMKIQLALANLSGRQVVHRVNKEVSWLRRDKDIIDALVADLLKAPEVPIDTGPKVTTKSVFTTWWFWTVIGGVAVGSTVAYFLASDTEPEPPKHAPGTGGLIIGF